MKRQDWHRPASAREVLLRAGGRRRYNRERQQRAAQRRAALVRLLSWFPVGSLPTGAVGLIARALKVSRSQLWYDRRALDQRPLCSACGRRLGVPAGSWDFCRNCGEDLGDRGPWCVVCGKPCTRADARAGRVSCLPRDWAPFEFDVAAYQELERLMCRGRGLTD